MAANNMNNLTTLIKRLEAATSRLEDIASSAFPSGASGPGTSQPTPAGQGSATPATSSAQPQSANTPPQAKPADTLPPAVGAYDELIKSDLKAFVTLSQEIGGVIAEQAKHVSLAFAAQRQFILLTTKAKNPGVTSPVFQETLKDTTEQLIQIEEIRQRSTDRALRDHLSLVADGVGVLGWVTTEKSPKPHEYVTELFGGAQMYGNKVLKEYKDKDRTQVDWVQSYYKLFKSLAAYTREYHATGVQWNPNGVDAKEALKQLEDGSTDNPPIPSVSTPAAGGAPPPPPPGPPPPPVMGDRAPAGGSKSGAPMGAVFDQLNRGSDVTKGLKKVDQSQMTHKNPSLRAGAGVPERQNSDSSIRGKSPMPGKKPSKPESLRAKKPPKKELDGNKWIIENYDSPSAPVEINAEINHSILITKCKNTTLRVNGKANAISIDNCTRFNIVLDSLVSSVDVIKCPNFALQVLGSLPTVLLDQVDGAQIYLSAESLHTEVFSSKCSSINVIIPPKEEEEDADYAECPVPEQIRSFVKDGKLVSEIVEHAG